MAVAAAGTAGHFSRSYAEARQRFLGAARARRCRMAAYVRRAGGDGDELAADVAVLGDARAPAVLVVSCGTHGVEGYAGSGALTAWLHDDALPRALDAGRVRVVLVHAVNPWGFAHDARTDDGNVDVNRNFRDFARPQPPNDGYRALHPLLVPPAWPPRIVDEMRLALDMMRAGRRAVQATIARGQCEFADGLFYGGREASWSRRTLEAVFAEHVAPCRAVAWIDLHTGLGRTGVAELIANTPDDPAALEQARAFFGAGVTSMYDGHGASTEVVGANFAAIDGAGAAVATAVTLELGTRSPLAVLGALRARQWLANHPDAPRERADSIRRSTRAAFYVETDDWKAAACTALRDAATRALGALARTAVATS
jgi:predicted deacylase